MNETRTQIFGENLKRIRLEKGYTRKQLADSLGVNVDAIGKYENAKIEPPLDKIFQLATFLEVSVSSLISDNDYNAEIPNIADIVDKKIFDYRYKRAVDLTSNDFLFPTTELDNGYIRVYIPPKVIRDDDGVLTFYSGESGGIADTITFKDKAVFVELFEKAEKSAIENHTTFYEELKRVAEKLKK